MTTRIENRVTIWPSLRAITALLLSGIAVTGCVGASETKKSAVRPGASSPDPGGAGSSVLSAPVDHDAFAQLGYRLAWRGFPILGRHGDISLLDVYDSGIVVNSTTNFVTFMEPTTGANRWTTRLGDPIDNFLGSAIRNGRLYIASDNEIFLLDDRTGVIEDRQQLGLVVSTPPTIYGSLAIFGSMKGEVLAHNLLNGFRLWGYQISGAIESRPTRVGDTIAVVSRIGDVIVLDGETGASTLRARIFGGLANDPVAGENAFYVASLDQSVYAFGSRGDSWDWRVRTDQPIREQPAISDGVLFVELPGEGFAALDTAAGGARLWINQDVSGAFVGVHNGSLIIWSRTTHTAFRVDSERGDVLAQVSLPDVERLMMHPARDGDLFASSPGGAVSKFTLRN